MRAARRICSRPLVGARRSGAPRDVRSALLEEHAAEPEILVGLEGLDLLTLDHTDTHITHDHTWDTQLYIHTTRSRRNEEDTHSHTLLHTHTQTATSTRSYVTHTQTHIHSRHTHTHTLRHIRYALTHARTHADSISRRSAHRILLDRVDRDMAGLQRMARPARPSLAR